MLISNILFETEMHEFRFKFKFISRYYFTPLDVTGNAMFLQSTSIIFNTNGYSLSKLITILSDVNLI